MDFPSPLKPVDTSLNNRNKFGSSSPISKYKPESYRLNHSLTNVPIHRRGIWRVLALNPNIILSASYDKTAKLSDVLERRVERSFDHEAEITGLSCNKEKFVTASGDGVLNIWSRENANLLSQIKEPSNKKNGFYSVTMMDSELIATGACHRPKTGRKTWPHPIKIWRNGEFHFELLGHTGGVSNLISVENSLISSSADKTIRIWDLNRQTNEFIAGHSDHIYAMAYLPSRQIVSGGRDKTLRLYDLGTGTEILRMADPEFDKQKVEDAYAHESTIYDVCVLQRSVIASASRDGTIKIWDVRTKANLIHTIVTENLIYSVCPIGHFGIAAGSEPKNTNTLTGELMIWELRV